MKTLVSWIAFSNDYKENQVDEEGPTANFHAFNYNHDRHIILSSASESNTKAEVLVNFLLNKYPSRNIEIRYLGIKDIIDINLIKTKVEQLLLQLKNDQIDIFFSPGTSAMQVAWYICHSTLNLNTKLIQSRPARFSESRKPEFIEIVTSLSSIPVSAILREEAIGDQDVKSDYLITKSIKDVYDRALKIAQTDKVTTLILGESGTGKEHLSQYIHKNSVRKTETFIAVNCSAFNDQLLEARLFGYKKGAFTGADKDTKGVFEEATNGTIFLDEIGDISSYMQQSLLRVIQEHEILPLGSNKVIKTNVRIISATNKDLPDLCEKGLFRWDLYYRLTVTELDLPNLVDRGKEELQLLINHFLKIKKRLMKKPKTLILSSEAKDVLLSYSYPGNVRELENIIEQLYVFYDDKVFANDLPRRIIMPSKNNPTKWEDVEKLHITKILKQVNGNQRRALKLLGYGSINTLASKVKKYDIQV